MPSSAPPTYKGPALSSEVESFLGILLSHGFASEATSGQAGKTIRIYHNGIWYGYINGSVLDRGIFGYRFTAWNHHNNACPPAVAQNLVSIFCERYECSSSDIVTQEGKGANSGRTFLIIKAPAVALRVLQQDSGQEFDTDTVILKANDRFLEGAVRDVLMQRLERSKAAREACLAYYGYECFACKTTLRSRYTGLNIDLIHVHHEEPLSSTAGSRETDPINDMKPVCPNCHAVIHSKNPPYSVAEVASMCRGEA